MNQKRIEIGTKARDELIVGANYLADAVGSTLGPFGKNFVLEKGTKITNDGVTIANEIQLKDEIQNRGVYHLREAAQKTDQQVGDGTTTTLVLAQAIIKSLLPYLSKKSKDSDFEIVGRKTPAEILEQLEMERVDVTMKLEKMAEFINSEEELISSARVSVEYEDLAELIGKTQFKLGPQGVIIDEDTNDSESSIETTPGIRIDNGFGTSQVINNQEKESLELTDVPVILTNYTLETITPLSKVLDQLLRQDKKHVVIIARAFSPTAIKECMQNVQNGYNLYPINAPYTDQTEIMLDLAAVTGAQFIDAENSSLEDLTLLGVGFASRFVSRRWDAFVSGAQDDMVKVRIEKRIEELKEKLKGSQSDFEKRNLNIRIAQFQNGFAVLKVGAISKAEQKHKQDKAHDAVNAVRMAYQGGVVPGAGQAFKMIAMGMPEASLLKRPLESISENIVFSAPQGFEIAEWVKDPVLVLKFALQNACSVAGTFVTAGGVIVTEREKSRLMTEVKNDE